MTDIIPSPTPYLCADLPEGALPSFLDIFVYRQLHPQGRKGGWNNIKVHLLHVNGRNRPVRWQ